MTRLASIFVLVSCLGSLGLGGIQLPLHAEPVWDLTTTGEVLSADTLLLDEYPNAYSAYSLRKLRSDYSGPAIRVRRSSDSAERDFGFTEEGNLDVSAIEDWLSGADGTVVTWYSQMEGVADLTGDPGPEIASGGTVHTSPEGKPRMYIGSGGLSASASILPQDVAVTTVAEVLSVSGDQTTIFEIKNQNHLRLYRTSDDKWWVTPGGDANKAATDSDWSIITVAGSGSGLQMYYNDEQVNTSSETLGDSKVGPLRINSFDGYMSEIVLYPHYKEEGLYSRYDNINNHWQAGPTGTNRQALLPQRSQWLVDLYDWLETIDVSDVELPDGMLQYDNSYSTQDELADLWLQIEGLTASSVTRAEPEWYTLDAGNGKGIEATGAVKANHNPKGESYPGNPPRSWQNEPAMWYNLDIPLSGGGQGNPWYQSNPMGRRAMVVATVDLMMHQGLDDTGSFNWYDMKGKAFLGMAEAYRMAGDVMSSDAQSAFEKGMERVVDDLTARGPRAVNTNMDMFALHGAAELYMATDNSTLQTKCVEMVKKALFGYKDGVLETNHKVFKAAEGYDGGVFDPSGFIMEGDQPDNFYMGESLLHLAGLLAAVTDRGTGEVESDWMFMEEVLRRSLEFRGYQTFFDPANATTGKGQQIVLTGGAGFAGRTGAPPHIGQANEPHKHFFNADKFGTDYAFVNQQVASNLPSASQMESEISSKLSDMDTKMASNYTANEPDDWSGWSPWTKPIPYLPNEGWYSALKTLKDNSDPKIKYPAVRGDTWNKALGGPPTGKEYWTYKDKDANERGFGFVVEAQAQQGGYGGWYGGKIESFWMEEAGVVLINRHGKTGCDRSNKDDTNFEDSTCWWNLDAKAGHHVWGRDENDNGFTTLLLRGRELSRTSTFDDTSAPTTVTVNNVFNDPSLSATSSESGEQSGSELEGSVEVENKFEVQSNGLNVTHTVTSDETDEVKELWASLPIHLRQYSEFAGPDPQTDMSPTTIEYWDGSTWVEMPKDTDSDGVPEIVNTTSLRLGRDYPIYSSTKYAYISFATAQNVRRSEWAYHDPYQTPTSARTVHIDLHGDPGTTKTLPAEKSVSYTIQTTDPTSEGGTSTSQEIFLQEGGNIVSTYVSPTAPAMDSVFAGLQSEVAVVENEAGEQYRPNEDINEIGQWNSEEAYLVHVTSDVSLSIEGDTLGTPSISLEEGWNWVPYFPPSPLSVNEAMSSITEDLGLVKDEDGQVYLPDQDPDGLEQMEPGEGYKVYVQQSTTLTYPEDNN